MASHFIPSRCFAHPRLLVGGFVLLVFCTGTAEFLVAGVLPQLANDAGVSIGVAGQTVTAYALGVAVGGPIMTAATAHLPRKGLALGLCVVFVIGVVITVVAPTFGWVLAGRVVSACSQATLFAIALTTTTQTLGPQRAGRAVAIVGSGLTVATVLGVPTGVLLGNADWRIPFVIVAVLAAAATAILAWAMPARPAPATRMTDEVHSLIRPPVVMAITTTVLGFAGISAVFTYLVPLLTDVTKVSSAGIPILLLLYGVGGFIGNLIAGRLTDFTLAGTLTSVLTALALTLALFPVAAPHRATAIALVLALGLMSTATIAPLQGLVIRHAATAPTLALAMNVGAFNLANAIGSTVGGWAVNHDHLSTTGWLGAPLVIGGLALSVLAVRQPTNPTTTGASPRVHRDID